MTIHTVWSIFFNLKPVGGFMFTVAILVVLASFITDAFWRQESTRIMRELWGRKGVIAMWAMFVPVWGVIIAPLAIWPESSIAQWWAVILCGGDLIYKVILTAKYGFGKVSYSSWV